MPLLKMNKSYLGFDEADVELMQKMLARFHEFHRNVGMPDDVDYSSYLPVFAIALLASQESMDRLTRQLVWLTAVITALTVVIVILTVMLLAR